MLRHPSLPRAAACRAPAAAPDLPAHIADKVKDHPCYSEEAHHDYARIHLPVAPACNIQCNYCNRKYDCANESRPGVTSRRLDPDEALARLRTVASRMPQLSVVGIAGPGDAVYDHRRTFRTLALIRQAMPDLKLCLSTNGLALPDHVAQIRALGIDHVTITINALDPEIGARIYPWIFYARRRWTGVEAARILLERQMEGLERLAGEGVLVKVNSVMIPGINDDHLVAVNAEVRRRGAFLHNVMPLIADPAHGTAFGLSGRRGPTPAELAALQDALGAGARLMRHCRQCRADAVGLLGADRSQDQVLTRPAEADDDRPDARRTYRAFVDGEHRDRRRARDEALAAVRSAGGDTPILVAVCSKGGGRVNQHFGKAAAFMVYAVSGAGLRFAGVRQVTNYCQGGSGEDGRLAGIVAALAGVSVVVCAQIGKRPRAGLSAAGIEAVEDYAQEYIEKALSGVYCRHVAAQQPAARMTA